MDRGTTERTILYPWIVATFTSKYFADKFWFPADSPLRDLSQITMNMDRFIRRIRNTEIAEERGSDLSEVNEK